MLKSHYEKPFGFVKYLEDFMRANVFIAMIAVVLSVSCAFVSEGATTDVIKVDQVWVVFKTHFDLGYTDLAENVFTKYRVNMMDGALKVIDQNRSQPAEKRFVWTVAGWPLARAILDREQDPVRKQRIEAAIREGRPPLIDPAAARQTTELILRIYGKS